jgi:transglutaminase-like putative cysteine protease
MRYEITHRTTYTYESPVTVCHYVARLAPRKLPGQACPWHKLIISPRPVDVATRADSFGNVTTYFEIEGSHHLLEVMSHSFVEVSPVNAIDPLTTPAWEVVRDACMEGNYSLATAAAEFCFASPLIVPGQSFVTYARPSFPEGRPILAGLIDLNQRIFADFKFDSKATDVATPLTTVMKNRRGVCQDFAHVMIACLRSLGLPARYVSGYLETIPPEGKERMVGADASHAWASLFCGDEAGWMDADPTNNVLPSERHITIAWGRDFSDVSPLRGVTLGAGEQALSVGVDVIPMSE